MTIWMSIPSVGSLPRRSRAAGGRGRRARPGEGGQAEVERQVQPPGATGGARQPARGQACRGPGADGAARGAAGSPAASSQSGSAKMGERHAALRCGSRPAASGGCRLPAAAASCRLGAAGRRNFSMLAASSRASASAPPPPRLRRRRRANLTWSQPRSRRAARWHQRRLEAQRGEKRALDLARRALQGRESRACGRDSGAAPG